MKTKTTSVKPKAESLPSIDKVTVNGLYIALRACGFKFEKSTIDKIIDLVELLEINGDDTTLFDVCKLQSIWDSKTPY